MFHTRTYFAYLLQDRDYHLEITNMEYRQSQPYMTEVAIALLKWLAACLAKSGLVGYAHTAVQRAIGSRCPVPIQVVK